MQSRDLNRKYPIHCRFLHFLADIAVAEHRLSFPVQSLPHLSKKDISMTALASDHQLMLSNWQQHTHAEFALKDAEAALATMTANPYVLCIPAGTGGAAGTRCGISTPISSCPLSRLTSG